MNGIRCPECGGNMEVKETRRGDDLIHRRRDCRNPACPHLVETGRYVSVWSKETVTAKTFRVPKTNTRNKRLFKSSISKKISKQSDKTETELELPLPEFKVADGME